MKSSERRDDTFVPSGRASTGNRSKGMVREGIEHKASNGENTVACDRVHGVRHKRRTLPQSTSQLRGLSRLQLPSVQHPSSYSCCPFLSQLPLVPLISFDDEYKSRADLTINVPLSASERQRGWLQEEIGVLQIKALQSDGMLLIVRLVFSFYCFRSVYIAMTRSIARRHTAQND